MTSQAGKKIKGPGSVSDRNSVATAVKNNLSVKESAAAVEGERKIQPTASQQFFYQQNRGAISGRNQNVEVLSEGDGSSEYSSGEEVETERERQLRLEKGRTEIQQRI